MKNTSDNRNFVKAELARLALKPFPPREDAEIKAFVDMLVEVSESQEHARLIVDHVERDEGNFPEIATFRRIASATRTLSFQRNPECQKCDASGHVNTTKDGYPYAKRCDCWGYRTLDATPWKREGAYAE